MSYGHERLEQLMRKKRFKALLKRAPRALQLNSETNAPTVKLRAQPPLGYRPIFREHAMQLRKYPGTAQPKSDPFIFCVRHRPNAKNGRITSSRLWAGDPPAPHHQHEIKTCVNRTPA